MTSYNCPPPAQGTLNYTTIPRRVAWSWDQGTIAQYQLNVPA
jgi:hypothetical protein